MTRDDIFKKVRDVLVDALAVDEEEVVPNASLTADLGAESIDFLDIVFKLEQAFGIKIAQGELFPEGVNADPRYVKDGKLTDEGMAALRTRVGETGDMSRLEKDRSVKNVAAIFTVQTLVSFVEKKLATK